MAEKAEKAEKVPVKKEEERGGFLHSPMGSLAHFRDEMDRVFDEFMPGWSWGPRRHRRGMMEPFGGMMTPFSSAAFGWSAGTTAADVIDDEKEVRIRAELPGVDEDDIEVRLSEGVLTIQGEKKEERDVGKESGAYHFWERRYGSFRRSFQIPEGIDMDKVDASFAKGVLTVTLPKTKEAQAKVRKIKIKGEK